jgi:Protein of unknown function (DUF998)
MNSQALTPGKAAAVVAIISSIYFFAAAIAAHLVSTQYNFLTDYISDYAIGPWGWIYGSAFWASCMGCFALAVALTQTVPSTALSRLGVALLVVVGLTYAIDFYFPTDILAPGAPPDTIVGTIHFLDAVLGWILFIIGAFLVSSRLRPSPYWRKWRRLLTNLAWVSAALLVALVLVIASKAPFGGFAEKAFIVVRNIWTLALALVAFNAPKLHQP